MGEFQRLPGTVTARSGAELTKQKVKKKKKEKKKGGPTCPRTWPHLYRDEYDQRLQDGSTLTLTLTLTPAGNTDVLM